MSARTPQLGGPARARALVGVSGSARVRWMTAAIAVAVVVAPRGAVAAEWEVDAANRVYAQAVPADLYFSLLRFPNADRSLSERTVYQAHLLARAAVRPTEGLGLELGIDTGLLEVGAEGAWIDGRPAGERVGETLLLGETFADLQLGASGVLELRIGKLRPRVARGTIFDAYALGVDADLDLGLTDPESPWRFHANLVLPDATFTSAGKTNPLVEVEVALQSHDRSELRLLGAAFFDRENGLAPVLSDAVFRGRVNAASASLEEELAGLPGFAAVVRRQIRALSDGYAAGQLGYHLETSGVVGWLGLLGRLQLDDLLLTATLVAGIGRVDVTTTAFGFEATAPLCDEATQRPAEYTRCVRRRDRYLARTNAPGPSEVKLRSLLAYVTADLPLSDAVALDGFLVAMSGDDGFSRATSSGTDTYRGFIGLAPFLGHTLIFFRGGVAGNNATPTVASIAPDGAGLVSFGTGVTYTPFKGAQVHATGAAMFATVESVATKSRALGVEGDLEADAEVADFLVLSGSGGVFAPGAYFGDLPLGWQVIASATLIAAQL